MTIRSSWYYFNSCQLFNGPPLTNKQNHQQHTQKKKKKRKKKIYNKISKMPCIKGDEWDDRRPGWVEYDVTSIRFQKLGPPLIYLLYHYILLYYVKYFFSFFDRVVRKGLSVEMLFVCFGLLMDRHSCIELTRLNGRLCRFGGKRMFALTSFLCDF